MSSAAIETVEVILPCLDEAAALGSVIAAIPPDYRVLVVDNGSRDGSAAVARSAGATVVDCAQRGYGAACHAGLEAASSDIVVVMDADGSLSGQQLPGLVEPIRQRQADLMIGTRRPVEPGAWPLRLRLANRQLARQLSARTGIRIRDLGAVRAARRLDLLGLDLQDRRSGYPAETVIAAADAGWRIGQVDVDYRARIGHSKVTGTWLGAFRAVQDLRKAMAQ